MHFIKISSQPNKIQLKELPCTYYCHQPSTASTHYHKIFNSNGDKLIPIQDFYYNIILNYYLPQKFKLTKNNEFRHSINIILTYKQVHTCSKLVHTACSLFIFSIFLLF
jgi:hypothetical protein